MSGEHKWNWDVLVFGKDLSIAARDAPEPHGKHQLGLEPREYTMQSRSLITALSCLGIACILAVPVVAGPPENEHHSMTAKCVKVVDGDTLIVKCDKKETTVDLEGVDAPELGQPWGKEVRAFVADMVGGRKIEVEMVGAEDGKNVARVTVDGQDLSQLLAARGLAWGTDHGELEALSEKAKSSPCGLWLDPDPVPPWEFREAQA